MGYGGEIVRGAILGMAFSAPLLIASMALIRRRMFSKFDVCFVLSMLCVMQILDAMPGGFLSSCVSLAFLGAIALIGASGFPGKAGQWAFDTIAESNDMLEEDHRSGQTEAV